MKAIVVKPFKDKETRTIHKAGQEITVSEERFEEINSTSFGVFIVAVAEPENSPAGGKESNKDAKAETEAEDQKKKDEEKEATSSTAKTTRKSTNK